jgi:hypothetical protein
MTIARHLRFVQAIALAATIPACSGASGPATGGGPTLEHEGVGVPSPRGATPTSPSDTSSAENAIDAGLDSEAVAANQGVPEAGDVDAEVDAHVPFSSGPIVPPELPEVFG